MQKNFNTFEEFKTFISGYNNHPIPLEFSQGLTTSELIHSLLGYIQQLASIQDTVKDQLFKTMQEKFTELQKLLQSDTSFFERYKNEIYNYCVQRIEEMIGENLKYITFTLEDGYLVAYVPDVWSSISFDTNANRNDVDFGKLIIHF